MKDYFDINRVHYFQNNLMTKDLINFNNYSHVRYSVTPLGANVPISRASEIYQPGGPSVQDGIKTFGVSGTLQEKMDQINNITKNNPNFKLTGEAYTALMNNPSADISIQQYAPQRRNMFVSLASLAAQIAIGIAGGDASEKVGAFASNRMAQDVDWMSKHPNSSLNIFGGAEFIGGQITVTGSNQKVDKKLEDLMFEQTQKRNLDVKTTGSVGSVSGDGGPLGQELAIAEQSGNIDQVRAQFGNVTVNPSSEVLTTKTQQNTDLQGINMYRTNINWNINDIGKKDPSTLLLFAKLFNSGGKNGELNDKIANLSDAQFAQMANYLNTIISQSGSQGKTQLMQQLGLPMTGGAQFTGADLKGLADKGLLGELGQIRTAGSRDALAGLMRKEGGANLIQAANLLTSNNLEINMNNNLRRLEGSASFLGKAQDSTLQNQSGVFGLLEKLKNNPLATISDADMKMIGDYIKQYKADLSTFAPGHNFRNSVGEKTGVTVEQLKERLGLAENAFAQLQAQNTTNRANVAAGSTQTAVTQMGTLNSVSSAMANAGKTGVDLTSMVTAMKDVNAQVEVLKKQYGPNLDNAPQGVKDFVSKANTVNTQFESFKTTNANNMMANINTVAQGNITALGNTGLSVANIKTEGAAIKEAMMGDIFGAIDKMGLSPDKANELKEAVKSGDIKAIESIVGKSPELTALVNTFNSIDTKMGEAIGAAQTRTATSIQGQIDQALKSGTSISNLPAFATKLDEMAKNGLITGEQLTTLKKGVGELEKLNSASSTISSIGSSKITVTGAATADSIKAEGEKLKGNLFSGAAEKLGIAMPPNFKLDNVMTNGQIDPKKLETVFGVDGAAKFTPLMSQMNTALTGIDTQVKNATIQAGANAFTQTLTQANTALTGNTGAPFDMTNIQGTVDKAKGDFVKAVADSMGMPTADAGKIVDALIGGGAPPTGLEDKFQKVAETLGITTGQTNGIQSLQAEFSKNMNEAVTTGNVKQISSNLSVINKAVEQVKSTSDSAYSDSSINKLKNAMSGERNNIVETLKQTTPIAKIDEALAKFGIDVPKTSSESERRELFAQKLQSDLFVGTNLTIKPETLSKVFGDSVPPQIKAITENYNYVASNLFNAVALNDSRKIESSSNNLASMGMTEVAKQGQAIQDANSSIQTQDPKNAKPGALDQIGKFLSQIAPIADKAGSLFMSVSQELFTLADKLMKSIEEDMDGTFLHENGASAFQRISGAQTFAEKAQNQQVSSLAGDLTARLQQVDTFFKDRTNPIVDGKRNELFSLRDPRLAKEFGSSAPSKVDGLVAGITDLTADPTKNKGAIIDGFKQLSALNPGKANDMIAQLAMNPNTASLAADIMRGITPQKSSQASLELGSNGAGRANISIDDVAALNINMRSGTNFNINVISLKSEQNPSDNGLLLLVKNSKTNTTDVILLDSKKQLELITGENNKKITLEPTEKVQEKQNSGQVAVLPKGSVKDITDQIEFKKNEPNIQAILKVQQQQPLPDSK